MLDLAQIVSPWTVSRAIATVVQSRGSASATEIIFRIIKILIPPCSEHQTARYTSLILPMFETSFSGGRAVCAVTNDQALLAVFHKNLNYL